MDMVLVLVVDVNTIEEQVEVHTILRQLLLLVVVLILYVLELHTHVVLETAMDVLDALPMLTVTT
tara:strand:- start:1199 stop:1393 length:195 start_codon:yes stop_codon:yes gene_type:complete